MPKPTTSSSASKARKNNKEAQLPIAASAPSSKLEKVKELSDLGRAYACMLADPKNNPQVPCIASTPDMVQQVKLVPQTASFQVAVGSAGYGMVVVNPTTCGPTANMVGWYSQPAFAGAGSSTFTTGTTGLTQIHYSNPVYPNGSSSTDYSNVLFRTTACGVYLTPVGSMTSQNGRLHLHETAGHSLLPTQITLDAIISSKRTRQVRGVQTGDPAVLNLLQWHPKSGAAFLTNRDAGAPTVNSQANILANLVNDITFRSLPRPDGGTPDGISQMELLTVITGTPGALYDVDIVTYYEVIGPKVDVNIPVIVNSAQFDIVRNGLGHKIVSGSLGKPKEITKSYVSALEHVEKVAHGKAVPNQPWYRGVLDTAKDVGGFALDAFKAISSFL